MSSHDSSTNPDPGRYEGLLPRRGGGRGDRPQEAVPSPVDQIAVRKLGGFNFLDPEEWTRLSRDDRMKLIKTGAVTFLFQGEEVPLKPALLYLQASGDGASPGRQARPPPGREGLDSGSA